MQYKKSLPSLMSVMALLVLFGTIVIHYQIAAAQENPTEPPPAETPEATLLPSPTEAPIETPTPDAPPPGDSASITVAMSAAPSSGAAPLTVTFSDASSPGLTDWAWDFGDGSSATGSGPHSHTYANPGTYTASLTASGSGGSGTASQQIVVFPPVTPVEARFTTQQTGETAVCFSQSSTGPVTTSAWDFGDGATSAETDPCHTYASTGQYTVTLTVTGEGGATSSAAQRISLLPQTQPPVAAFTMSRSTAAVGQTVRLTDQSLGLIQTWFWDFGDGTTSSERQPSKQYSANGTYTVTLTVSGPGGSDQETAAITIAPEAVLTCSFSAPSSVFAGETVTLRNTSRVSPGSFSGFTWFVDGVEAASTTDLTTAFSIPGTVTVRLVGLTEDDRSCESQRSLTVLPAESVIANFSGIRSVIMGEELCLRDQSRGAITAWAWDFGDDGLSTEVNPCHAFSRAGRYDIRLTVTGASGASDSRSRAVTVYDPPTLSASASPLSGIAPLAVSFSAEGTNLTSYQWSFPDGSRAFSPTAQFVFDQPGDYTVSVTGSGPVGSLTSSLWISVRAPGDLRAAFGASAWNGIAPLEICFTDRSAGDAITAWGWNFGDGATSADPNPCHTFDRAGEYPVSLSVSNGDGLSASATSTVRIYSPASGSASFRILSVNDLTVCYASSLQDGLALSRWEFGDGSTSTESAPCHPYPAPGVYAVTLIVTDLGGVERALRSSVSVSVGSAAPVEAAAPSPNREVYDPALSKIGFLPAGSIGLPGEALHWVTTVTNVSGAPESNLVIVDQVRPELRIDSVMVANGSSYTVNGQRVEVTIPSLLPGQSQDFTIVTTVLTSPLNGILDNTVTDNLGGSATAFVSVPASGIVANIAPPLPDGPIPLVNGVPELVDFAGRQFCFTPNFTNAGTREGYGPYITLVRDANLALNSISYLGMNLTASPFLVASGLLPAVDPIEGRAIPGTVGQAWITVRLPIGSLETISPPIPIDICMQSLPLAALGVPMPISIYPGYEFGDTPTGAGGPISNLNDQGPMDNTGSFTPILVTFRKSNTLPESEVPPSCYPAPPVGAVGQPGAACAAPPGVQWPYEYVLSIELAAGQTLTANTFTDTLDSAFEFYPYTFPVTALADAVIVGGTCTPSGASATFDGSPVTALPALQPPGGGTLAISFTSIANPSAVSTCTLTMRYRGFINDILSESAAPEAYAAVNNASFAYSHVSGPQPV
ncbi:MAG: PKD domain-containing protein, partial [Anaerolineae bacterium]|nr:PKD domain-containing protein [Anaerolineae bacterium]